MIGRTVVFRLNKEQRTAYCEVIYLVYFAVMISARALGMYEGTTVYTAVLLIAIFLFGCKILMTDHTMAEYVVIGALMGISGVVYLHTGEKGLIVCFMTVLGMKYVNHYKVIRIGTVCAAVCIIFRIITGVFGILPEKYYPQVRDGVGLMFRHSLGYAHPNTLHMNVLMLSMLIIYLLTSWLKYGDPAMNARDRLLTLLSVSVIVMGFNYYVFMYSGSRTGLLASAAFLIVNLWFFLRPEPGLPEKLVCYAAYPTVCFIAIVLPFILPDSVFDKIDRTIFTTRFSIARYYMSNNSISVWGIRLNNPLPEYRTYGLDMSHMYLFLQLGLVAFATVSIMTMVFVYRALSKKMMCEMAVLLGTLFAGIWEPFLYNLGFKNITYVFMGALLYEITSRQEYVIKWKTDNGAVSFKRSMVEILNPRALLWLMAISVMTGTAVSAVWIAATPPPTALYGNLSQDESGQGFGMEELYLTAEDIRQLKDQGDMIIGYNDSRTPMYRYDSGIAEMEYRKKALSVGVWTGTMTAIVMGVFIYPRIRKKYKTNAGSDKKR